jgi:putative transposase
LVIELGQRFGARERQACAVLGLARSVYYYRSSARDSSAITLRIRDIVAARPHYGCQRVFVMLRREGWPDNHKRVHRLYRQAGLSLRLQGPRRHRSARRRQAPPPLTAANQT